jgi:hypothetical protein
MEQAALYLTAPLALDSVEGDSLPSRLTGVAYSGGLASQWGEKVAIDLSTLAIEPNLPLLYEHQREAVVGTVEGIDLIGGRLELSAALFTDIDPLATSIAKKAQRGLRWQLSIGVFDAQMEQHGGPVQLNEQDLPGPVTVLRKGVLREVSIVTIGADRSTSTEFFTAGTARRTLEEPRMPDPTDQERIAALEAQIADLGEQLKAATVAREEAESAVADMKLSARKAAVQALFSEIGRPKEDVAPYLGLSDESFAIIAADLRAMKPQPPAHLFTEQATGEPASSAVTLSTPDIYAKRRAG